MRYLWLAVPICLYLFLTRTERGPEGVQVPESPIQVAYAGQSWDLGDFRLTPLAEYRIRARILRRSYYWIDAGARLSPLDLAVGWGPMSDTAVLDRLSFRQSNRFLCISSSDGDWPLPFDEMNSHSANMHIVPADSGVRDAIRWTRDGSVVRMTGYLIQAEGARMNPWRSSLTRTDTGSGACELMYVTTFHRE